MYEGYHRRKPVEEQSMNRINQLFKNLRRQKRKALVVYVTAGDPSLAHTERLVSVLEESGADLIELGIPFSDPLADGPTIQKASQRALSKGVNIASILKMVKRVRRVSGLPIVFMTYYNLVLHYGLKRFVADSKASGIDGVIVPDLPPEEGNLLVGESRKKDFSSIFLAAPTSTKERLKKISSKSTGFIYYVSLTGTTGARDRLPGDIVKNVKTIKRISKKPVCVGFGISNPRQARRISRLADGIIVGSAVIKVIENNSARSDFYKKVGDFVKRLAKAVHGD